MNDEERVDLREMLTDFWVGLIQSSASESSEKLKASEMLAKYILGEGRSLIKKRTNNRPSTSKILELVRGMEDSE